MHFSTKRILLLALILTCSLSSVQADNTPAAPSNPAPESNAVSFAIQAGFIAGAAQACGQDPTVFMARVNESLDKLALSPMDKVFAMNNFQKTMQQARTAQINTHPFRCSQVIQDFNGLPLMRADYQQTVINQLALNDQPLQQGAPATNTTGTPLSNQAPIPNGPTTGPIPPISPAAPPPSLPGPPNSNIYAPPTPNNAAGNPNTNSQNSNSPTPSAMPPSPNPYTQALPNGSQQSYQSATAAVTPPLPQAAPAQAPVSAQPPPYNPRN